MFLFSPSPHVQAEAIIVDFFVPRMVCGNQHSKGGSRKRRNPHACKRQDTWNAQPQDSMLCCLVGCQTRENDSQQQLSRMSRFAFPRPLSENGEAGGYDFQKLINVATSHPFFVLFDSSASPCISLWLLCRNLTCGSTCNSIRGISPFTQIAQCRR